VSNRKILVLGGGVAGSSIAHYLSEKHYDVTLIEKNSRVGGLARTCYYGGHPYEFGPHIWFWPGGKDAPINRTIVDLTNDELYYIDRRLFTYVRARSPEIPVSGALPGRGADARARPDRARAQAEPRRAPQADRVAAAGDWQLHLRRLLHRGDRADAVPEVMANYTWKMWNIPGDELETRMVWADRFESEKGAPTTQKVTGYDPLKFDDHTLGKGIKFQVYPQHGWNAVLPGAAAYFPRNAIDYALEHNLIAEKAYPQQSAPAFRTYDAYVDRGRKIPNLRYVGRHAEFKYWGMAETVNSAYLKSLEFEPV
jgi:hypothetical protein